MGRGGCRGSVPLRAPGPADPRGDGGSSADTTAGEGRGGHPRPAPPVRARPRVQVPGSSYKPRGEGAGEGSAPAGARQRKPPRKRFCLFFFFSIPLHLPPFPSFQLHNNLNCKCSVAGRFGHGDNATKQLGSLCALGSRGRRNPVEEEEQTGV